jgi:ATP-dependent Clp protease ATP-binding subunit ClpC
MSHVDRYTQEGRQALIYAREEALQLRHKIIAPEHLVLGILRMNDPIIECILARFQVSAARLREALEFVIGRGSKALLHQPMLGQPARAILAIAARLAEEMGQEQIGLEHLLLGVLSDEEGIAVGVLESFGLTQQAVRRELDRLLSQGREYALFVAQHAARYNQTPTLNQVSRDLTAAALAGELDPVIGREDEIERTMQILSRRSKNNPVLIGPAGVGKTAIAEGLALRIIAGQVPENLQGRRVVTLDVGLLTVGTRFRGDFEERLKRIMQEIIAAKGIIIVIDELHSLVGTGVAEGSIDAANLFKPMLARGEFQCIGATTFDDYRKTIEADPALERRFQPIIVNETTQEQTLNILCGLRPRYADFHHVTITDEALLAAVQLSTRYISSRYQPDKSIDLIDEAAARVCVQRTVAPAEVRRLREALVVTQHAKDYAVAHGDFAQGLKYRTEEKELRRTLAEVENSWLEACYQERPVVDVHAIAGVVSTWTGIPVSRMTCEEAERLLRLEDELHRRVIGQHEAVASVARAIRRARTDIRDSRRPIGSFLFVGPTGVGKTELARALAETLFGDEEALIQLDMSEFMEPHHVSRLVGAPPGYVGYEQAGQLTEAVKRRPYSVVLFDEIEKAHPSVFDLLLQILDDGCLTDAQGHTVNFKQTVIIITSNAGTAHTRPSEMAFTPSRKSKHEVHERMHKYMRQQVMDALRNLFRPELLNRLDDIIFFHILEPEHLREIVDLMIARTQQRLAEQDITLSVTEAARSMLVVRGYDPVYGARPLRRTVQRMLDDMLAEAILRGEYKAGDVVEVDVVEGELVGRLFTEVNNQEQKVA